MTQTIIALLGLSGVGKSTVLRRLAAEVHFQHLQASAIIRAAREVRAAGRANIDELRKADIDDNQALLVTGFLAARDPTAPVVVLDGHSVIDTPQGLVRISSDVFAALGVELFIFLADDTNSIAARRLQDNGRQRPVRSPDELAQHQLDALENTFAAARARNAPLLIFSPAHISAIRSAIQLVSRRDVIMEVSNSDVTFL